MHGAGDGDRCTHLSTAVRCQITVFGDHRCHLVGLLQPSQLGIRLVRCHHELDLFCLELPDHSAAHLMSDADCLLKLGRRTQDVAGLVQLYHARATYCWSGAQSRTTRRVSHSGKLIAASTTTTTATQHEGVPPRVGDPCRWWRWRCYRRTCATIKGRLTIRTAALVGEPLHRQRCAVEDDKWRDVIVPEQVDVVHLRRNSHRHHGA
jgi:hypothetical protein